MKSLIRKTTSVSTAIISTLMMTTKALADAVALPMENTMKGGADSKANDAFIMILSIVIILGVSLAAFIALKKMYHKK